MSHQQQQKQQEQQRERDKEIEESVLKDVLEQLEKERIKRAEVEAELFSLRQKTDDESQSSTTETTTPTRASAPGPASSSSTISSSSSSTTSASSSTLASLSSSLSSSASSTFPLYNQDFAFDDADRVHKINATLSELKSTIRTQTQNRSASRNDFNKKRNKQSLASSLTKLFTDLQDAILVPVPVAEGKRIPITATTSATTPTTTKIATKTATLTTSTTTSTTTNTGGGEDDIHMAFVNKKSKEIRVKDEVTKTIVEYNKAISKSLVPLVWRYDEDLLKPILNTRTFEFVSFLLRLYSHKRLKDVSDEIDKMRLELTTLRVENDGYLEIINAMTPAANNHALMLSCKGNRTDTLSLEVVQMLELMPWDDRAHLYTRRCDRVDQWQVYNTKTRSWVDKLDLFPNDLISLTIREKAKVNSNSTKGKGKGKLEQSHSGRFVDASKSYPLPKRGTWEWIGGWGIDGVTPEVNDRDNNNDDEKGWTYAENPRHIVSQMKGKCFEQAYDEQNESDTSKNNNKRIPSRKYRRRTWTRLRVLKSYPGISRRTSQLLNLFEQNSKLLLTVEKLQDQIFQMQNQLIQKDVDLDTNTVNLLSQLSLLELENDKNTDLLKQRSKECDNLKSKAKQQSKNPDVQKENKPSIISWGSRDSNGPSLFKFNSSASLAKYDARNKPSSAKKSTSVVKYDTKNKPSSGDNSTAKEIGQKKIINNNVSQNSSYVPETTAPTTAKQEKTEEGIDIVITQDGSTSPQPKTTTKRDVRNSPQAKQRTPLISLREITIGPDSDTNTDTKNLSVGDFKALETTQKIEDEYVTIFQKEGEDEEKKVENNASSSLSSSKLNKQGGNRELESNKPRNVIDTFPWKINKESILQKVKSKVKDVEINVHNVKNNVQGIVEKAHSIQKMAHQVN